MRTSDWSSDVCSSDLVDERTANPYAGEETKSRQCLARQTHDPRRFPAQAKPVGVGRCNLALVVRLIAFGIDLNVSFTVGLDFSPDNPVGDRWHAIILRSQIGRASGRERGWRYL